MYDVRTVYEPKDLREALKILKAKEDSIIINGGSDVLIKNRNGKFLNNSLVSINQMEELKKIYIDDKTESIMIGSTASFTDVEKNSIINDYIEFLAYAAGQVGGPQVRNIGTLGGNICNAATSADTATSLLVLDSILHLESVDGIRRVALKDFYTGPGKSVRKREEILTFVEIKKENYDRVTGHYIKYAMRKAMDIATLSCAVLTRLSEDKGKIEEVKIAYGVAAPTPIRAFKLEDSLRGKGLSEDLMKIIDDNYTLDINPRDSWRASKEFRLKLINELTKRGLDSAVIKGGGKSVYSS